MTTLTAIAPVASVAHVIRHLNPQLSIVAEVLSPKHELLFGDLKNISLVYTMQMAINLLIQETQDPGVNLLTQVMTSNRLDGTLASTRVNLPPDVPLSYASVAKSLLDDDVKSGWGDPRSGGPPEIRGFISGCRRPAGLHQHPPPGVVNSPGILSLMTRQVIAAVTPGAS